MVFVFVISVPNCLSSIRCGPSAPGFDSALGIYVSYRELFRLSFLDRTNVVLEGLTTGFMTCFEN